MLVFDIFILISIVICLSQGLEFSKQQRYNPTTDFLAHETGGSVWPKRDYVAPSNNDYNAQFPSLGSPRSPPTSPQTKIKPLTSTSAKRDYVAPQLPTQKPQNNDKRDYVAPQNPTQKPQNNDKRDYVAPQHPTQKPQQFTTRNHVVTPTSTQRPQTQPSGKRDYVSPQFTTQKPTTGIGKVKDLINFFDNNPKNQNGSPKAPSYSNILQGNNNLGGVTQSFTPSSTRGTVPPSTKPMSFSSIVGGSNKPSADTTQKPSTRDTNNTPTRPSGNITPTNRPGTGSPVLPSTLLNNNQNNNQLNKNGPTDAEIQSFSEELLRKDTNNAAKYITINYQQKTTSQSTDDKAPQPLLSVASEAWNIPTVQKLVPLLDNYERDTMINEHVTPQERNEENAFMDVIMNTAVIRHLMNFLKENGYVSPDPRQQRDFMKQLWFNLYSRGKGKISSSGFEHVFVSELKNGVVQGLHNWIYFSREEAANRVNYLGYLKYQQMGDKGAVLKLHFNQQGLDKPVDTMFIGTSPELEMALYTLCFVTRADNDCNVKLGTKDVNIVTHTFRYRSKNYIGSAYPQI